MQKKLKDKSLTLQDMTHINNIDENMITGMIKTETKIKLRSQLHPWYPILVNAISELYLWKLTMSEKQKQNKKNKTK